ncbi:sigma-70 family RNA polymerase sigma factor [Pseudalkalibacillus decolorationis]|uniref:sigma-70 family RNA polymerase sigma factor n=1 Tax=Pseudalkalibacillus decolorationis TaxID=163879 RepID=UPI0021471CED|nr:sigma-70 family RNA polymerase sigma factor [Pseudalkalibacillus decolorationis]
MTKNKQQLLNRIAEQQDFLSAFLQSPENEQEIIRLIENPTIEHYKRIDRQFQAFCFECRFIHYVSRMIYFQAINYIRKLRKSQSRLMYGETAEGEWIVNAADLTIEQNEIASPLLFAAMSDLTSLQKQIVELHYQRGWKLKEIANYLNVSPQSISKTHRRALDQLQLRMEGKKYA